MAGFVDWLRMAMGWASRVPSSTVTVDWITAASIVGRRAGVDAEIRTARGVAVGRVPKAMMEGREP